MSFLDKAKHRQICMSLDLIERPLFVLIEKIESLYSCQRLGHEPINKIELFIAADDVFDPPVDLLRRDDRIAKAHAVSLVCTRSVIYDSCS